MLDIIQDGWVGLDVNVILIFCMGTGICEIVELMLAVLAAKLKAQKHASCKQYKQNLNMSSKASLLGSSPTEEQWRTLGGAKGGASPPPNNFY